MIIDSIFRPILEATYGPEHPFWYTSLSGGGPVSSGVNVTQDSALTYSACWAATRLLCGAGAGLPLKLYKARPDRGRDLIIDHPSIRTLATPSKETLGILLRSAAMNHQINAGNGYCEIERAFDERVVGLYPIHSSRVRMIQDDGAYVYRVRNNDGSETPLGVDDMLHFRSMMTKDGVTGLGVVVHARESIGFGIATERHGAAYFGNGARPGIILKHPKQLDADARANLRREWNEIHQGAGKHHQTAVLQEGMTADILPFNAHDSQFLESRQHNVEEIARWYGVPPHMIQHLLRATYSNISHQSIEFVVYNLLPWLQMIEAELNRKLLTEQERAEGYFFKHVVLGLLRGDEAARAAFYKELSYLGVLSPNDICELEDRNPIGPEGDQRFVQQNMVPLDKASAMADANIKRGTMPKAPPVIEDDEREDAAIVTTPSVETTAIAKRWLADTMTRMMRKEINEAKRAAKSSGRFVVWIEQFYAEYRETLQEAVIGPLLALGDDPPTFVDAHVADSKRLLLQAAECLPDELEASVARCVEVWHKRY